MTRNEFATVRDQGRALGHWAAYYTNKQQFEAAAEINAAYHTIRKFLEPINYEALQQFKKSFSNSYNNEIQE